MDSGANCTNENKWFIVGNSVKNYNHGCNGVASANPALPSSICKDVAVNVQGLNLPYSFSNDCPANEIVGCNGCPPPGLIEINGALNAAILKKNSTQAAFDVLVDGGNTQNLLDAINSSMGNNALRNLLEPVYLPPVHCWNLEWIMWAPSWLNNY